LKITAIKTQNFIGARDVDVKITKPICLFAGKNASGKSSLQEAVRMSLTGESVRVSLKKDYGRLIAEGQTVGYAVVEHDGQQSAITLPNGSHEHTGNDRLPAVLPYVLDAQRFSSLPANERRAFLFGLMGLRTDGDTVGTRMLDKGCDPIKVDEIRPHMRAGFDAAHKEAQSKARDAKAAWRATTGETYGSVKAATWRANKPEFSADRLRLDREEFHRLCEHADEGARTLGDMQGRARTQAAQSAKLAGLRERAGRFARIDAKLQKDVAELAEWQAKVEHEARKGGKQMPVEPTYTCPACSAKLRHDHANGALVEFTPPPIVSTCEPGELAEYQKARDLLARSVENDKRDLADADSAAKMLAELDTQDAPAPAPEEIEAARVKVEATKKQRAALQEAIRLLEADEKAAAQAEGRTVAALGHHADVAQWEEIAGALAPNGIPGEMLGEALEPINDRLAKSANETEWLRVGIESDMTIDAAGRPYALLSESERWRVDAMIAEAISHLSGVKLLVLDRVDVLDFVGREDLLYWLDGLAADGEIDSALLFATLKALPASLPENIEAIWIENGIAGKVMAAA
jgi:hypothetical protein